MYPWTVATDAPVQIRYENYSAGFIRVKTCIFKNSSSDFDTSNNDAWCISAPLDLIELTLSACKCNQSNINPLLMVHKFSLYLIYTHSYIVGKVASRLKAHMAP